MKGKINNQINDFGYVFNKSGKYPNPDLVGEIFGKLTILEWKGRHKCGGNAWLCYCSCGNTRIVGQGNLRSGDIKSCGCLRRELKTKHGYTTTDKSYHPLYIKFRGMKQRCYDKNFKYYECYGGRGIKICEEWIDSPEKFIEWGLENGYKEGLTIERINNDEGYSPKNCCFIDRANQCNNRRSNHLLTHNDKTQNITQWAREVGINRSTLSNRIKVGWSVEKALTLPIQN